MQGASTYNLTIVNIYYACLLFGPCSLDALVLQIVPEDKLIINFLNVGVYLAQL